MFGSPGGFASGASHAVDATAVMPPAGKSSLEGAVVRASDIRAAAAATSTAEVASVRHAAASTPPGILRVAEHSSSLRLRQGQAAPAGPHDR